jgi:hypothetical protein
MARDKWNALLDTASDFEIRRAQNYYRMMQDRLYTAEKTAHSRSLRVLLSGGVAQIQTHIDPTVANTRGAKWRAGVDIFARMVGPNKLDGQTISIIPGGLARPGYDFRNRRIVMNGADRTEDLIHELGHWFEHVVPDVLEQAIDFWRRRTVGDIAEELRKLSPHAGYLAREFTLKDDFYDPYAGKVYYRSGGSLPRDPRDSIFATEIVSMGMQRMYVDPAGFAQDDPQYFDFIWGLVR